MGVLNDRDPGRPAVSASAGSLLGPGWRVLELAREFRTGRLLPSEVTERLLDKSVPGPLFRLVTSARARSQAARADEFFRDGVDHGPLQGVPIGLKDLIDTEGEVTMLGCAALSGAPPASEDADVASSLDSAGGVFIGKTTMTELAFSGLGLNQHSPIPANALDRRRVPGGSSSGSAVAVASGLLPAAIGSDTGGSVRIPAAFNGLVGLKPSEGALSMHGVARVSLTFDTLGPITWDTADAWALWAAMTGSAFGPFQPRPVAGLRFAVPTTLFLEGLDDEVGSAFEQACERLARGGAILERVGAPVLNEIHESYLERFTIGIVEAFATFGQLLQDRREQIDPRVVRRLTAAEAATGVELARLHFRRRDITRSFWRAFQDYDAILAPTVPIRPPYLDDLLSADEETFGKVNSMVVRNTRIANYLGCPAVTVPAPFHGTRTPTGFMTMTRPGQEHLALSVGHEVERASLDE
jgi:aspartyl-tRNA(Asn)/glutamyl-tRNA(Gln) amidotransferase subunit A